jgi:hypothetical protein
MRKSYLFGLIAALFGLGAIAVGTAPSLAGQTAAAYSQGNEPYHSCRLLHNEQRKCGFGFDSCDQQVIDRLEKQCLLDDGGTISWPPNAGSPW